MKRLIVVTTLTVLLPVSAGAQQPAARQTDLTTHGGIILAGMPTVLIGGLPAARAGDQNVESGGGGSATIINGAPTVLIGG